MTPNFKKFTDKGRSFINEVAVELGDPNDKGRAYRVLRSVLHTLRNKIAPQESLQLIAQLPMFIKAVYVEGWKWTPGGSKIRHLDEFIRAVEKEDGAISDFDFQSSESTEEAIKAVFRVLKKHVSEGEIADIISSLPAELKPLMA